METSPTTKIKEERESQKGHKEDPEEGPSKISLQQKKEGESRSLTFQYDNKTHGLTCNTSQTVLDALKTNPAFTDIRKTNQEKEIVIRKNKGKGAAVNTDYPCMLLESNEILKITFIKKEENPEEQPNTSYSCPSEDLVSFNVKTKGGENVRRLMRNNALATSGVDYVCVYAFKGEKFEQALRRDKRFKEIIFGRNCELTDCDSETIHQMSENVDKHNNKNFEVNVTKYKQLQDSKDTSSKDKTTANVPSDAQEEIQVDPSQHPANTAHENTEQSTSQSGTAVKWQPIQGSEEILKLLRDQFKVLLKQLKEREKRKTPAQVRQFYREEYDKSCQSFSEVKTMKKVINLSNSVCQIRLNGSAKATGFLLFNKFILTNAHVIGFGNSKVFNPAEFKAVFGYEDLDNIGAKYVQIINLTSSFYGKDEKGNHLDYALLEFIEPRLNSVEKMSELLHHYRNNSPNNRSQICIVGHPDGKVKKMDPCFVIGRENRQEAEDQHVSENFQFFHVMTQRSLEEKWQLHKNQITYDSCFFHGSSGSPVFDADCKLIGIHTGGYVYPGGGEKTRSVMEYAYPMQPILDNIKAQARIKGNQEIIDILNGYSDEEMEIG
ncbi:serine protease FAM111A-like [Paramisgurnus dabryanus]|uniref:serine protease FAM111A-like n=1 Tax=Paramisgurnus dabryanus TaxID=90735 RepID=UPI0031F3C5A9